MTGCRSRGAIAVGKEFRAKVAAAGLQDEVAVIDVGCHGQCALAPVVVIEPQDYFYGGVQPSDVDEIIEVTLRGGQPAGTPLPTRRWKGGHDRWRDPILPQPAARRAGPLRTARSHEHRLRRSHGAPTPPWPRS